MHTAGAAAEPEGATGCSQTVEAKIEAGYCVGT